jgi:hypothetical protein
MESSTETLLIVLITILSVLAIIALAAIVAFVVALRKLLKKVELATDAASESVFMIRNNLLKRAGLLATLKYLPKLFRRN